MFTWFFAPGPVTDWDSASKSDTEAFGRFFRGMIESGGVELRLQVGHAPLVLESYDDVVRLALVRLDLLAHLEPVVDVLARDLLHDVVGADGTAGRCAGYVGVYYDQVDLGLELEIPTPPEQRERPLRPSVRAAVAESPVPGGVELAAASIRIGSAGDRDHRRSRRHAERSLFAGAVERPCRACAGCGTGAEIRLAVAAGADPSDRVRAGLGAVAHFVADDRRRVCQQPLILRFLDR